MPWRDNWCIRLDCCSNHDACYWRAFSVNMTFCEWLLASSLLPYAYSGSLGTGKCRHYCDVIMGPIASQITSLTTVYSIVYSDADQRKHQSSMSLAFVQGIHRGPVNSPHKWPVTRKMFPFDDVIMRVMFTRWHPWQIINHCWNRMILIQPCLFTRP